MFFMHTNTVKMVIWHSYWWPFTVLVCMLFSSYFTVNLCAFCIVVVVIIKQLANRNVWNGSKTYHLFSTILKHILYHTHNHNEITHEPQHAKNYGNCKRTG